MKWKKPHITKFYEAFWVIVDKRIEIQENRENFVKAKVYSSSRNKFYTITFDKNKSIMSNDNSSFYVWDLGYPSIALLLEIGFLDKNDNIIKKFSGIKWKDINVKNKNDFDKTWEEVLVLLQERWLDLKELEKYCNMLYEKLEDLDLEYFWEKILPPEWY